MGQFNILHISDLHFHSEAAEKEIPKLPSFRKKIKGVMADDPSIFATSHDPLIAEHLANFLILNSDEYDILIYTGDLATTGDPADLAGAKDLLCSPAALPTNIDMPGRCYFNTGGKEIVLLPGNHDRYQPDSALPGSKEFDKIFFDYWDEGYRVPVPKIFTRRDGTKLAVIRADFTLYEGDSGGLPFGHLGRGRVYEEILTSLIKATEAIHELLRNQAFCVLWCLHFDPKTDNFWLKLIDSHTFELAAGNSDFKIAAILCGHTHKKCYDTQYANRRLFISGAAIEVRGEHSFHRLQIDINPDPEIPIKCHAQKVSFRNARFEGLDKTICEWRI